MVGSDGTVRTLDDLLAMNTWDDQGVHYVGREPRPEEGKLLQAVLEKERAGHDATYWEAERAAWSRLEGLEVGRHEAQGDRKGPKGGAAKGQG